MEKEQEAVKDKKKMDIVSANPLYKYVKGVFTLIGKDGNSTLFLNVLDYTVKLMIFVSRFKGLSTEYRFLKN